MAVMKCKMCGGNLEIADGVTVAECEYCGSKQTVPSADSEKKVKLFERANKLRTACEFDKAYGVYESIVAEYEEEAEAYWGLVLCKYGIEYVDDPKTGRKIPTCHRSSYESVMDDENFELAMENTDAVALQVYREEAKQIEEIRKGIIEVSMKEEPYDIFICYKETDENGERTLDSVLAQDVYDALTAKGYRVFFSRITLEDKLGVEYEPYIFAALNSARVMLAFGTKYEYYNAVWVKNEWSRFLQIMEADREKHLIPCYKDIDIYDIPKEFTRLQAQDLGKVGAIQDLLRGIEKIIGKKESGIEQKYKKFEETPQNKINNLLKRGYEELADRNWQEAKKMFDDILMIDVENTKAYIGLFMCKYQVNKEAGIPQKGIELKVKNQIDIYETEQYIKKACQYADSDFKKIMEKWKNDIRVGAKYQLKYQIAVKQFQDKRNERTQLNKTDGKDKIGRLINEFTRLEKEFVELGEVYDSKKLVRKCKTEKEECIRIKQYQEDVDNFIKSVNSIPEVEENYAELNKIYNESFWGNTCKYTSASMHKGTLLTLIIQVIYLSPLAFGQDANWGEYLLILEYGLLIILWGGLLFRKTWLVRSGVSIPIFVVNTIECCYKSRTYDSEYWNVFISLVKQTAISQKKIEFAMEYLWIVFVGITIIYFIKEIARITQHNKKVELNSKAEELAKSIKGIWSAGYQNIYQKYAILGEIRKSETEVLQEYYQSLDNYIHKIKNGK